MLDYVTCRQCKQRNAATAKKYAKLLKLRNNIRRFRLLDHTDHSSITYCRWLNYVQTSVSFVLMVFFDCHGQGHVHQIITYDTRVLYFRIINNNNKQYVILYSSTTSVEDPSTMENNTWEISIPIEYESDYTVRRYSITLIWKFMPFVQYYCPPIIASRKSSSPAFYDLVICSKLF